jgi:outer membrane receptor for ferric coprogen and ferric-rhodotorulic acid
MVSLEGGSYGDVRGTADFGGVLDPDGKLLYRLAATGFTSGSHINREVSIIAAYTYQHVVYEGDSGTLDGKQPTEIPAQYFSVYGDYTVAVGKFDGFGGGLGVRHNGNTLGDQTTEFTTSSYTLLDMRIHYDFGKLS